jgi:oxygen-independent coproporphyrinogen-3 oxidase
MPLAARHDPIGLYLHIPFCERRCHFCAFFTQGYRDSGAAQYVEDLLTEIREYGKLLRSRAVETIYFGGGTPTMLSVTQLTRILSTCRETFCVRPDAEITVEANPANLSPEMLGGLQQSGFNRLSLGAQSFDHEELNRIGSPHDPEAIRRAVGNARRSGFANLNLDLIYGLPRQSLERLRLNLQEAIALYPEHISYYGMTVEEGTLLSKQVVQGRAELPGDSEMAEMYEFGRAFLEERGYLQYEASNFARPGYTCRHNLGYWADREWLGLGSSAHSYLNGQRFSNVESLDEYHRRVSETGVAVSEREPAESDLRLREAIAFGLRTTAGVGLADLSVRYQTEIAARFQEPIERLSRQGLLLLENGILRPTRIGLAFADDLAMAFL